MDFFLAEEGSFVGSSGYGGGYLFNIILFQVFLRWFWMFVLRSVVLLWEWEENILGGVRAVRVCGMILCITEILMWFNSLGKKGLFEDFNCCMEFSLVYWEVWFFRCSPCRMLVYLVGYAWGSNLCPSWTGFYFLWSERNISEICFIVFYQGHFRLFNYSLWSWSQDFVELLCLRICGWRKES